MGVVDEAETDVRGHLSYEGFSSSWRAYSTQAKRARPQQRTLVVGHVASHGLDVDYARRTYDWRIAALGDYNGDAAVDILWRSTAGRAWMWLMRGPRVAASGYTGSQITSAQWVIE
jgi:hypothetical protein